MSFDTLKITELRKIADSFGVTVPEKANKQQILLALEEEGVTYDTYSQFDQSEKEELEVPESKAKKVSLKKEDSVLVRMDKANHSYTIAGYTFTQEHPFVAMPVSHAQKIFDTDSGFRLANPREVQEYYN